MLSRPLRAIRQNAWIEATLLLAALAALLAIVQFSTDNLFGNDGYYHIKTAYLMRTQGLKLDFNWLPLTVLNVNEYVDHHFLYHILLIPFTFGDLRVGAKWASVLLPAFTFLALWWLLRGQKVPYAALWTIAALAVSEAFVYRMSMPRAQALSLGVLLLGMHWMLTGRYRALFLLSFAYVWLYNAYPLIIMLALIYMGVVWVTDKRLEWEAVIYAASGVMMGLLVNPYFPQNIVFSIRHMLPKLTGATEISVGNEWFAYSTSQLMENSGLALLLLASSLVALGMHKSRADMRTWFSMSLVLVFGIMTMQSRRFIEYWPAFILVLAAFAWAPVIGGWQANDDDEASQKKTWLPAVILIGLLVISFAITVPAAQTNADNSRDHQRYAEASAWLIENTVAGTRVFQTDWDDFPQLFFHNHHNTYIVGLDPSYMQQYSPQLYDIWVDLSRGKIDEPSTIITNDFGASWVISDLKHGDFIERAESDERLVESYRDEEAVIFEVIP